MDKIQLFTWLSAQSQPQTITEISAATGVSEADLFPLLIDNLGVVFAHDDVTDKWSAIPAYVNTIADDAALAALNAAICNPTTCSNDVDAVLTTTGVTKDAWIRGNTNTDAIVAMLRCVNLRTKLAATGLDLAKLDGMLDSCDAAIAVNVAMSQHHGMAGV
ncbi:MAG: hypothetical protein BWK73_20100 [Thiothrix lacustris]|uniref:Uncharacterized protein n=1 Tax=Thiothrix lacustris TaxID=525917 RepID=A0A1Y1QP46_9GAMM|nr:MAG: hypothetical protein BWK73_20100 [Thiothrix lacustris]